MKTQADIDRGFLNKAMSAPYLSREEERELALLWKEKQDQEAMHCIAQAHMRLVISMSAKFRHYGLPIVDLIQEGNIGLMEAITRFDPERDVRFSTYAGWWIRASMQDYVLRNWSIVRGGTSSAQKALFFNLRRLRSRMAQGEERLSDDTVYQEIALAIGVSQADVAWMDSRLSGNDQSLNIHVNEAEGTGQERQDFLVSADPTPDVIVGDYIDGERRSHWINKALDSLNDREKYIIKSRKLCDECATLEELGRELGISKERVRQIENRSLEKMKQALLSMKSDFNADLFTSA